MMKLELMSVWLYFAPFIALWFSFIVPYFVEPEPEVIIAGSSMGQDYEEYLAGILE